MLTDDQSRRAVETVERWSDGLATDDELKRVYDEAGKACNAFSEKSSGVLDQDLPLRPEWCASVAVWNLAASIEEELKWATCDQSVPLCVSSDVENAELAPLTYAEKEKLLIAIDRVTRAQCALLREVFGNPFRPITLNPSWLTFNITALAQKIYSDRTFDRLPLLADELEKSGCDNGEILGHCRGSGLHVRGCWALDLVLGKG